MTSHGRKLAHLVATTAVFNVATAGAAAVAGVLIARAAGPEVRGQYAAVVAWLGVLAVVGQLGQPQAVPYYVARDPGRAKDYVAAARTLALAAASVVAGVGLVLAPVLAGGQPGMTLAYRVTFVACLLGAAGTAYTSAMQSIDIRWWNWVRLSQPVLHLAVVVVLVLVDRVSLMAALWGVVATLGAQAFVAYLVGRSHDLAGGHTRLDQVRPVGRYGLQQLAAAGPTFLVLRMDQLVLSLAVAPAVLGHYAVAGSLTALAVPVVAAVGNVAFPHLASRSLTATATARLQRSAVLSSALVGTGLMTILAVSAPWLVPFVFGPAFGDAVPLVWILAPGGVFLACGQVCGDLLRGQGRPLAVARAMCIGVAAMAVLLAVLIPAAGVAGAAAASSVASGLGLAALLREVDRPPKKPVRARHRIIAART